MDYQELKPLEDNLREVADQLRANSQLTASEYSMPVLCFQGKAAIFLPEAVRYDHLAALPAGTNVGEVNSL